MRVGISGTHGTGKTTLAEALCAHLPGHVAADEPYYLLEDEGYEFSFPHRSRTTGHCWHVRCES
jgi:uridine kinase